MEEEGGGKGVESPETSADTVNAKEEDGINVDRERPGVFQENRPTSDMHSRNPNPPSTSPLNTKRTLSPLYSRS